MNYDHFDNRAARLAVDLANARHATDEGLAAVLAVHGLGAEVRARGSDLGSDGPCRDVEGLRQLGRDLHDVLASDRASAARRLNALLEPLEVRPRITTHDDRPVHLHFEAPGASLADRVRANTLLGLAAVLCVPGPHRFGACAAEDCEHVFVDRSRNGRRRFCSPTCANRTHVAAHRRRRQRP